MRHSKPMMRQVHCYLWMQHGGPLVHVICLAWRVGRQKHLCSAWESKLPLNGICLAMWQLLHRLLLAAFGMPVTPYLLCSPPPANASPYALRSAK
mmetsp:Transcript_25338/g.72593  ORF Transcript_25338/g.72593 Transcript_25338/m.72593 type:complete len:95 (-) Transcript_25338:1137-1421(-)